MGLEHQILAVTVGQATVRLLRWQGRSGEDIYLAIDPGDDTGERVVVSPSGYDIEITARARLTPEEARAFATAVESAAERAIHLRQLDGDKL